MKPIGHDLSPQILCKIALLAAIKQRLVAVIGEYLTGGIFYELSCIHVLSQPQSTRDYTAQDLSGTTK